MLESQTRVAFDMFRVLAQDTGCSKPEDIFHDWKYLLDHGDGLYVWYLTPRGTGIERLDNAISIEGLRTNLSFYEREGYQPYLIVVHNPLGSIVTSPHNIGGTVIRSNWRAIKDHWMPPEG